MGVRRVNSNGLPEEVTFEQRHLNRVMKRRKLRKTWRKSVVPTEGTANAKALRQGRTRYVSGTEGMLLW